MQDNTQLSIVTHRTDTHLKPGDSYATCSTKAKENILHILLNGYAYIQNTAVYSGSCF